MNKKMFQTMLVLLTFYELLYYHTDESIRLILVNRIVVGNLTINGNHYNFIPKYINACNFFLTLVCK